MRKIILLSVIVFACLSVTIVFAGKRSETFVTDTTKISHTTDGTLGEWNQDKFETDKETQASYAVDHDANNIYIAMKIPSKQTQMKMMIFGMNVYIDTKGRKRESMGIEFPVKRPVGSSMPMARGEAPDMHALRERMAGFLVFMKYFGFENESSEDESKMRIIGSENGINIAYTWDDADVMYIEYQLPISLIGTTDKLTNKTISIGWKLNGRSMESSPATISSISSVSSRTTNSSGGAGGGSRGSGPSGISRGFGNGEENSAMTKEQSFWTKHTLTF